MLDFLKKYWYTLRGCSMKKLKIIYEDKHLIVVYKRSGLLTISRDNKNDINLYDEVKSYLKKQNPKNKVFIVHRLDKDTSGLVLFAKSEYVKLSLQSNWEDVVRKYYAVVEGIPLKKEDTLVNYLYEKKNYEVVVSNKGKKAITEYKVLESKKNSLLDIQIKTGRKNQIRVQLAYIGNPIVGDKAYGHKNKRMYLEAYFLEFKHPVTKKIIILELDLPEEFKTVLGKSNI